MFQRRMSNRRPFDDLQIGGDRASRLYCSIHRSLRMRDIIQVSCKWHSLVVKTEWCLAFYLCSPLQMCLLWESLATRNVALLSQALEKRHNIVSGCAWVNYVRSHDDIGWTFADEGEQICATQGTGPSTDLPIYRLDALELGKEGGQHRKFLNAFFVNRHPGSFARGVPFQDNPKTVSLDLATPRSVTFDSLVSYYRATAESPEPALR